MILGEGLPNITWSRSLVDVLPRFCILNASLGLLNPLMRAMNFASFSALDARATTKCRWCSSSSSEKRYMVSLSLFPSSIMHSSTLLQRSSSEVIETSMFSCPPGRWYLIV
uniref:STY2 n=1 Tax=Arundo donax TaxID=35708 RepID=A0A0A9H212_ARUDO